ncbi:hypothetical protein MPSEU_000584600 [Mayamaea pseudoterrestris]|nr:hypothetical protein MPSEU_000584600 [Mayamaea pseudoterrestris]
MHSPPFNMLPCSHPRTSGQSFLGLSERELIAFSNSAQSVSPASPTTSPALTKTQPRAAATCTHSTNRQARRLILKSVLESALDLLEQDDLDFGSDHCCE